MKVYQKFFLIFILIIFLGAVFLETAFASVNPFIGMEDLADRIYNIFFTIGISLAILMLMFGGFIWFTSLGNPQQIKQAKERIFSALIGLVILVSSASLLALLGIGPGRWLLRAIGIDIPVVQEEITVTKVFPLFCAEISLDYNLLQTFLNQQEKKADTFTKNKINVLARRSEGFKYSAREYCNPMHGAWAKCVEPFRKATFARSVQYTYLPSPALGRKKRTITKDGCSPAVRGEQNRLRTQNKNIRNVTTFFTQEIIEKTKESNKAKQLKIDLEKIFHCQLNEETILYAYEQARAKGIIDVLKLNPVSFYCCTRDFFVKTKQITRQEIQEEPEQEFENPLESLLISNAFSELERQNSLISTFYTLKLKYKDIINASENIVRQIDKCEVDNIRIRKEWNQEQQKWEKIPNPDVWARQIEGKRVTKGRCYNIKIAPRSFLAWALFDQYLLRGRSYNKIFEPRHFYDSQEHFSRRFNFLLFPLKFRCPADTYAGPGQLLNMGPLICCPKIFWHHLGRCPLPHELNQVWAGETCPLHTWEILEKNIEIIRETKKEIEKLI